MATNSSTKENKGELSELEQLKQKLFMLEKRLEENQATDESSSREIRQDEYIPVMSLVPYTLTLSTKERGQGSLKKFQGFGEIKNILFRDLVDIIEVHPGFTQSGYFYILDKKAVEVLGLKDQYENILSKEQIDYILDTQFKKCVEVFKSAQPKQQRVIIELLTEKMKENPSGVNLNIVDEISRESGIDIRARIEDMRRFEQILQEEE